MSAKFETDPPASTFKLQFYPLLASVPAALTAALLGSRLGVQGTLIGAALTALVSGVVMQFASFGIERSHQGLKLVVARRSPDGVEQSDEVSDAEASVGDGASRVPAARPRRRVHVGVALAGVVATALATFGVTMGVLTAAESAAGRSVDGSYSSTVQGASGGKAAAVPTVAEASSLNAGKTTEPEPTASPSATPSVTPTETTAPTTPEPTSTPSAGGEATTPAPSPSDAATPTA